MRYVIVDTAASAIANVVEYDAAPSNPPEGFAESCIAIQSDRAGPDWSYDGGTLVAPRTPDAPPPVPPSVSDRQFFQQLAIDGIITREDALAAVRTGVIPSALQQFINGLPPDQQFAATMIVSGATTFARNHPLTKAISTAYGWSSDRMDALFRAAALL